MLYEVSFEVCNMVGGIHTVIKTKVPYAQKYFGSQNYILIGPYLGHSKEFKERTPTKNFQALADRGIIVHEGTWDIPSLASKNQTVYLLEFNSQYVHLDWFKAELYKNFGIESLFAPFDVNEPMAFSLAVGKLLEYVGVEGDILHSHEWMCGYANLYLKIKKSPVKTVFTTHATMLGRALSSRGINLNTQTVDPKQAALETQIVAKHTAEIACAKFSDVFTTVSDTTAKETAKLLEKSPDFVTYNGIDIEQYPISKVFAKKATARQLLERVAHAVLGTAYNPKSQFWIVSGRHEPHNKGYDIAIESFAKLKSSIPFEQLPILFVMVPYAHFGLTGDMRHRLYHPASEKLFCTHYVQDNDLLQLILKVKDSVPIIYIPAYVEIGDGLFNMPYIDLLPGFDYGVFPSYYEPWGYTPIESLLCGVPTVTSNSSGFGQYYSEHNALAIVKRMAQPDSSAIAQLTNIYKVQLTKSSIEREIQQLQARELAYVCDWDILYQNYIKAYRLALKDLFDTVYPSIKNLSQTQAQNHLIENLLEKESHALHEVLHEQNLNQDSDDDHVIPKANRSDCTC
jgi:glycogen phosphorylase/synthase